MTEKMIPDDIAGDRIKRLLEVQEQHQRKALSRFIGQEERVLVEGFSRRSDMAVSGKGTHGISITMPGCEQDIGQIIPVRVTDQKNNTLTAERMDRKE